MGLGLTRILGMNEGKEQQTNLRLARRILHTYRCGVGMAVDRMQRNISMAIEGLKIGCVLQAMHKLPYKYGHIGTQNFKRAQSQRKSKFALFI